MPCFDVDGITDGKNHSKSLPMLNSEGQSLSDTKRSHFFAMLFKNEILYNFNIFNVILIYGLSIPSFF